MNTIRYVKDILIEKMAIHIVDQFAGEPTLSENYLFVNEESELFARKHIIKALNDSQTYACNELSETTKFSTAARVVINDHTENFLQWSKDMAKIMFNTIRGGDIPSCDILCVQFITNETRCFGVLKLDYKVSHKHNVFFNESKQLEINLVSEEIALPSPSQQLKKAVFFCKAPENKLEMIVLDKPQKFEEANIDFFVDDFIEGVKISDDTDKTRKFKSTVEKWTRKNLSDQIEAANVVRSIVEETLLGDDKIQVGNLTNQMFSEVPEIKESFKEAIGDAGYRENLSFGIDKNFIDKSMKFRNIRTDSGFTIKGEFGCFKDSQKYIEKINGDGSIDIIIKNVRNIISK